MVDSNFCFVMVDEIWWWWFGDCKVKMVLLLVLFDGLGILVEVVFVSIVLGDGFDDCLLNVF